MHSINDVITCITLCEDGCSEPRVAHSGRGHGHVPYPNGPSGLQGSAQAIVKRQNITHVYDVNRVVL